MQIRRYKPRDTSDIISLFRETILTVNIMDYSKEQVETWANSTKSIEEWQDRLQNRLTYVVLKNGEIIGFGNLVEDGMIDLLYTHKDYQRLGVGSLLINQLEIDAKLLGYHEVHTEASITAKPFFENHGYRFVKKQMKVLKGLKFSNFIMKKRLL